MPPARYECAKIELCSDYFSVLGVKKNKVNEIANLFNYN